MRTSYRKTIAMTMFLLIATILSVLGAQMAQASDEAPAASIISPNVGGDPPFLDVEVKFIVYPNGLVVMSGGLDYDIVPPYTGPLIDAAVVFTESGELTLVSGDLEAILPPEFATQWPFNATNFDLHEEYSEDILSGGINCTVILPPAIASQSPLDVTDFVLLAECSEGQISGTITAHILSGFPLGDVDMSFSGNREGFTFEGSVEVIYGTYFDQTIDESAVRDMIQQYESTLPGQEAGSLYQITEGFFECTELTTTMTPYDDLGATIDFTVEISGDFIDALAYTLSERGRPPMYSMLQSSLAASFSSIEDASLELSYAYAQKEASMRLTYVVNGSSLAKDIPTLLPETVPPEMKPFIEALLNTTYCSVESADLWISYADGEMDLEETVAIEGDLNAELNYVKAILFEYAATTRPLTQEELFIDETKLDVSSLKVSFELSESSMVGSLDGFGVSPPIDVINATSFKLEGFFRLTEDMPFPGQEQRLKVTIEGGTNTTHGIVLFRPETVPEPDIIDKPPDYPGIRSMVWNNQTISDLRDVIFNALDIMPPVADAGPDQTVDVGTPVAVDAAGSTDNVGIVSCEWDFGDGTTGAGDTTTHTYGEAGTYTVTLTVRDAAGNSDTTSITVNVQQPALWAQPWFPALIGAVVVVAIAVIIYAARRK